MYMSGCLARDKAKSPKRRRKKAELNRGSGSWQDVLDMISGGPFDVAKLVGKD